MKQEAYIWRDAHDPNMYSIGIHYKETLYSEWARILCDGVDELFGEDFAREVAQRLPGEKPIKITLSANVEH